MQHCLAEAAVAGPNYQTDPWVGEAIDDLFGTVAAVIVDDKEFNGKVVVAP